VINVNLFGKFYLQKNIIKQAYEDAYGGGSQNEMDSCFNSKINQAQQVFTYQSLLNELKNNLSQISAGLQLKVIQSSYSDYFGIAVNAGDKNVKNLIDSSTANDGMLYKTLMEQHRLYAIENTEAQKAIINRSFRTAFGRDAKIAEMDSWFNACRNGGCAYRCLLGQLNEFKKTHSKPAPPVLAMPGSGVAVYTQAGAGINEACNCVGEKMYLVNADEINTYKVIVASYNYKHNNTTTAQYIITPKQQKLIGCTKDIECLYSIMYSVVRYTKM
jgi:hypothetical protein